MKPFNNIYFWITIGIISALIDVILLRIECDILIKMIASIFTLITFFTSIYKIIKLQK